MKVVHEIYGQCQSSGSVRPYKPAKGCPQVLDDGYADILIVSKSRLEGIPDEAIYFEGTAKEMLVAFKQAIKILERSLDFIAKNKVTEVSVSE